MVVVAFFFARRNINFTGDFRQVISAVRVNFCRGIIAFLNLEGFITLPELWLNN
jgi:hypothetical protein